MPSLDIASIGLEGTFVRATDPDYDAAIARGSELAVLHPTYVAYPTTFEDVPKLIKFARSHAPPLELAVKSGGQNSSPAASSEGGLVIDLKKLNRVTVEGTEGARKIRAQAGALAGDVYAETVKHGLDAVVANVWTVGLGGFLTGGGHSNLTGVHGLGLDNILEATVALSDGRILKASETKEPDLFWAILGGTNQFGIALEFVLKAHPTAGAASVGALVYPGTDLDKIVAIFEETLPKVSAADRLHLAYMRAPPDFHPSLLVLPYISGPPARADELLASFRTNATPLADMIHSVPNQLEASHSLDAMLEHAPSRSHLRGMLLPDISQGIDKSLVTEVWGSWKSFTEKYEDARETVLMWEYAHSGKIAERGEGETAFSRRYSGCFAVIQGQHRSAASDEPVRQWVRETATRIRAQHTPDLGTVPNFVQLDEPAESIYSPANLARMRKLKAKYDPDYVWRRGIKIEPDFGASTK